MSIKSHNTREGKVPATDPKWYPTTRGLNRWINRMARRTDLAVRVLKKTSGAPARFVPREAEIDINEGLIAKIDPKVAGSAEFVIKHRAIAGACVHEACHARHSTMDLERIHRQYGARHSYVLTMLEEGRCETQQWDDLTDVEKIALQSMVLDIVLDDLVDEDGNVPDFNDPRQTLRLLALVAARVNVGIIDTSLPKAKAIYDALVDQLAEHFGTFYDLAVRFSQISLGYYASNEDDLHKIVREWIAAQDEHFPPPEDEGGDEGEDGDEGDGGSGKGEGEAPPSDPQGQDGGKSESSDESDDGDADGSDDGDGDEEGEGDDRPGDDDEGEVGDGSNEITDGDGDPSLGQYGGNHVGDNVLNDIFRQVGEAAIEAEKISGSRLKEKLVAVHKATAESHAERRRLNKEWKRKWQQ